MSSPPPAEATRSRSGSRGKGRSFILDRSLLTNLSLPTPDPSLLASGRPSNNVAGEALAMNETSTVASAASGAAGAASPQAARRSSADMGLLASRFVLGDELGRGGEGVVFRGTDVVRGRASVVVKRRHCNDTAELQEALMEPLLLARVSGALSRHFPLFVDSLVEDKVDAGQRMFSLFIVQEFVPGGDLLAKLRATPPDARAALPLARWCAELCQAVALLHRLEIVHRDIKLENILLRDDAALTLVLCDFGCAVSSACRSRSACDVVGSTFYLAPELIQCTDEIYFSRNKITK